MIHICRVIFFSKLLGSWKKLFFHLVVIIHKARVLRQFDAVFISNFYVFAITNAGLYNQFVLGKQWCDSWIHRWGWWVECWLFCWVCHCRSSETWRWWDKRGLFWILVKQRGKCFLFVFNRGRWQDRCFFFITQYLEFRWKKLQLFQQFFFSFLLVARCLLKVSLFVSLVAAVVFLVFVDCYNFAFALVFC